MTNLHAKRLSEKSVHGLNDDDDDEEVYDPVLEMLNEMIAEQGFSERLYNKWLKKADAFTEGEYVEAPRQTRQREDDAEPAPMEAYARLPREYCEQSRQLLKPFDVGVLGAVLIHAKSGKEEVARRALLKMAGSGTGGADMQRLETALEVLRRPVGDFPPPLLSFDVNDDGKLKLEVDPDWLPESDYVKVAWPPPKDALACSLYLWLVARNPRRNEPRQSPLNGLLADQGYTRDHPLRDLKIALAVVNERREKLGQRPCAMVIKGEKVRFTLGAGVNAVKRGGKRRQARV